MVETFDLPQGKLIVAHSDKNLSVGLLKLMAKQELDKHNRHVEEELVQIAGTSVIKFDGEEVVLKEGDKIIIPANQFHIHSNQSDSESVTLWKFKGDITSIIEAFRN